MLESKLTEDPRFSLGRKSSTKLRYLTIRSTANNERETEACRIVGLNPAQIEVFPKQDKLTREETTQPSKPADGTLSVVETYLHFTTASFPL